MKNIWKKATKIIPGGNTLISKRPNLWLPETWPTHFVKSNNIEITDSSGKKYDDFLFAVGTNPLGYANTKINSNIIKAIKKGSMSSLNAIEEYTFAEKILDANKWANMAKFTRSGGEANTIAIRIARAASNKDNVAFCGYHGWHDWYVSSNIVKKNSLDDHLISGVDTAGVPEALNKTIFSFRYNDYKRIEHLVRCNNIGTIIMEVKRYLDPENFFLKRIRKLCNDKKIVLIFDECTTGFRQTYGGLHVNYGVNPDMAMYGKAIGNGFAINAVIGKKEIMEYAKKSFISSTFWGERIGFVAGLATLDEMKKTKSWVKILNTGKYIINNIQKIADENKIKIEIIGIESIPTFIFKSKNHLGYKTLITQEMLKKNMLASNLIYVSTKHNKKKVDKYLFELNNVFKKIRIIEDRGNLKKYLKHNIVDTGFSRLN
jgi:glutamate-1-semialdehyde aminotransferase